MGTSNLNANEQQPRRDSFQRATGGPPAISSTTGIPALWGPRRRCLFENLPFPEENRLVVLALRRSKGPFLRHRRQPFLAMKAFGRPNEPPRNEPFRSNSSANESFQNAPTFARQESFGRSNEQRNEPFRGNMAANESFTGIIPTPTFSRTESFGRTSEPPRNEPFRGNSVANESFQKYAKFFSR